MQEIDDPAALRAALRTETRIAEALAQRSRGLVDLVEGLARRALDGAADIPDARRRLDIVARSLREGLDAGSVAQAGDLRKLVETTLAAFDFDEGPRISIEGPPAILTPQARRLVALTLFDLASRSERFGALATRNGRVAVDWRQSHDRSIRMCWREVGGDPKVAPILRGAGGPLLEMLKERLGWPLSFRSGDHGLEAELVIPSHVLLSSGPTELVAAAL